MSVGGLGAFFIIVAFIALFGAVAWIVFTHLRARRLGLPQPTFASYNPFNSSRGFDNSGGGGGWFSDKIRAFKNRNNRSQTGGYEEPLSSNVRGRAASRGFGPLDPDDAWDARVGNEADAYGPYEEQELGLHDETGYHGVGATPDRGRNRSTEPEPYIGGSHAGLDRRYDEEMGRPAQNPFGDDAAVSNVSLRGVSPRPIDTKAHVTQEETGDSPSERRSMFREDV
jgi:hypothetical protein